MIMQIWKSFRSMPAWVQVWVAFILVPINMASLFFIQEPGGLLITFLANIGMMLNMPVMIMDKGFSKAMALPHIIPWTILIGMLFLNRPEAVGNYDIYLTVLLVTNMISLAFDYPDALKWLGGDRKVSGA